MKERLDNGVEILKINEQMWKAKWIKIRDPIVHFHHNISHLTDKVGTENAPRRAQRAKDVQ